MRQRDVIAAHRTNDLLQWQRHLEVSADVCVFTDTVSKYSRSTDFVDRSRYVLAGVVGGNRDRDGCRTAGLSRSYCTAMELIPTHCSLLGPILVFYWQNYS